MPPSHSSLSYIPDAHVRARNGRQLDGARETLVTLGVIVLQTDLKLDGLEEVSLLLVLGVVQKLPDILAHSGYSIESASESPGVDASQYSPTVTFDMVITVFQKNP